MAVATVTTLSAEPEVKQIVWVLTTADATGDPVPLAQHRDRAWQATGTWGGATMAAQCSNVTTDATFGPQLNAVGGAAITETANSVVKNSVESGLYVRAKLTTAGVGATVTVTLIAAASKRY